MYVPAVSSGEVSLRQKLSGWLGEVPPINNGLEVLDPESNDCVDSSDGIGIEK